MIWAGFFFFHSVWVAEKINNFLYWCVRLIFLIFFTILLWSEECTITSNDHTIPAFLGSIIDEKINFNLSNYLPINLWKKMIKKNILIHLLSFGDLKWTRPTFGAVICLFIFNPKKRGRVTYHNKQLNKGEVPGSLDM